MTDRDPTPPARPLRGTGKRLPDAAATDSPTSGTSLRDRWWWSPTFAVVVGLVVVGYQLGPIRGGDALWLNWLVAALGLGVAVYGAVGLLRAYRSR